MYSTALCQRLTLTSWLSVATGKAVSAAAGPALLKLAQAFARGRPLPHSSTFQRCARLFSLGDSRPGFKAL